MAIKVLESVFSCFSLQGGKDLGVCSYMYIIFVNSSIGLLGLLCTKIVAELLFLGFSVVKTHNTWIVQTGLNALSYNRRITLRPCLVSADVVHLNEI